MKHFLPSILLCASLAAQTAQVQTRTTITHIPASSPTAATPSEAPPPAVKPEDKCSIEGTVVNATTGEPLKKAHLSVRPIAQQNAAPYGTTTDNAGHFVMDGVDPGKY